MARPTSVNTPPSASEPAPRLPPRIFAGTSGWAYPTWKPGFYPKEVSAKKFLPFYSSRLNTVEVNYTFRTLPSASIIEGWLAQTPAHFRFSFKAPQRITHFNRLVDCNQHVADLLASLQPVASAGRLGLVLFQLPPNFKADLPRLEQFLQLPALRNAPPIAFEFRHESCFAPEVLALLTQHNAALCIAESDTLETPEIHTAATHACFRLRRNGGYEPAEVAAFAKRFTALTNNAAQPREVYLYFKHEDEPTGALNATAFLEEACALMPGGVRK